MTHPVIDMIQARRTINLFQSDRDITDAQISELIRLATTAPTAFNLQNWRFIAAHTPEAKARLRKVGWDQAKITDAAVTFIVCGVLADHTTIPDRLRPVVDAGIMNPAMVPGWEAAAKGLYFDQPWRQRDEAVRTATFGAGMLIMAAQAMGMGSAPMIGFDPDGVSDAFDLAGNEIPALLLAVGYPTDENWPQKPRRPLSEVLQIL